MYRFKIKFEQQVREEAELIVTTDIPIDDRRLADTLSEEDWFPQADAQNPGWLDNCVYEVHERNILSIEKLPPE